jgi:thiol-disulfide isomerase/thioredoxin
VDDTPAIPIPAAAVPSRQSLVSATIVPPEDRVPAPRLPGLTLDGRPVVLNAWASWCVPCRQEIPEFVEFARSHSEIRVLGLNVSDDPGAAAAFRSEVQMAYPTLVDDDGTMLASIPGVPPAALPSTIVIDTDGLIAARIIGPVAPGQLASIVESALGGS